MNWQSCVWRSKSPFEFPDQSGQIVIRHRMRGSALSPATLPGLIRLAIIVVVGLEMSPMRLKENPGRCHWKPGSAVSAKFATKRLQEH